ncbi:TVP38/TMEM64 family protein [Methylobacterium durans]|uniref:TVP38/TMEM64 family protein n=1 Tax=Methylobacterium durans TaxID=2202825 RepID=UPI002B002FF2|nr:TVP38/TMEM64 family protein [Methylobacterium durans]MEA1833116.1 TVP38/TMEM64 family protein [Methylobacterium durans]
MTGDETRYWLVTGLAIAAALAAWYLLPVDAWLTAFKDWARGLGPYGPIAFAGLFVVATLLVIPCTPLTIAAGVAFGWWSLPIVLAAATVGSVLAFVAGRTLLQDRVRALIARRPAMKATVEAVGEGGWQLLTLMRLSPFVPFNAQNYVLGITDVRAGAFLVSTLLGMLPGTVVCVYLGVIGRAAGGDAPEHWISLGLGLVATFAAVGLTRRRVRAKLRMRRAGAGA